VRTRPTTLMPREKLREPQVTEALMAASASTSASATEESSLPALAGGEQGDEGPWPLARDLDSPVLAEPEPEPEAERGFFRSPSGIQETRKAGRVRAKPGVR
jgi:hypothetical protein